MNTAAFEQLVQALHPQNRLVRAWPLLGGVSARVTALEFEADGLLKTVVVRQHGSVDLARNPRIALDEFRLLSLAQSAGLAVPTPYFVDQSGALLGSPCVVVEFVEGAMEFDPAALPTALEDMASHLWRIHQLDPTTADLLFLPRQEGITEALVMQAASEYSDLGRLVVSLEPPTAARQTLVHGDFWPGNLLWKGDRIRAIIDWEDAAVGDPLSDVANTRLEVLWAFGREAMELFMNSYGPIAGQDRSALAYWDLWAALRRPPTNIATWNDDPNVVHHLLTQRTWFIAEAITKLAPPFSPASKPPPIPPSPVRD